jgi:hypothetical protein
MRQLIVALAVLAVGLVTGSSSVPIAHAETVTVCQGGGCTFSTIGAAIASATPGETIQVGPGCYDENLDIENVAGPGITIQGAGSGNPAVSDPCFGGGGNTSSGTFIDGGCDDMPTVYILNSNVVIQSVTIQDGCILADYAGGFLGPYGGAGVYNDVASSTQILDSWIVGNFSAASGDSGGGVYSEGGASLQMRHMTVAFNVNVSQTYSSASGITNFGDGVLPISDFAASRTARPHPANQALHRGVNPAHIGAKPAAGMPKPPANSARLQPLQAGRHAALSATTASGARHASSIGLDLVGDIQVTDNYSAYGPGGIGNEGSGTVSLTTVDDNFGGTVGGISTCCEDFSISRSSIEDNSANNSFICNCLAGGLLIDPISGTTTLQGTPITGNMVASDGSPQAGGIGLVIDPPGATWAALTLDHSPVTGNTPPQCATVVGSGGGIPPC